MIKIIGKALTASITVIGALFLGFIVHAGIDVYQPHDESLFHALKNSIHHKMVQAYVQSISSENMMIQAVGLYNETLEIKGVQWESTVYKPDKKTLLKPVADTDHIEYSTIKLSRVDPKGINTDDTEVIFIDYEILSTKKMGRDNVSEIALYDRGYFSLSSRQTIDLTRAPFLRINREKKKIHIKQGSWTINNILIIPEGHVLTCSENTRINLIKGAFILSYSPVIFHGKSGKPIVITSTDKTGQGLVVLNASGVSQLQCVNIGNLSNPQIKGWAISGAVNFYQSDVIISECLFQHNVHGDDMLNIIRSRMNINKTKFSHILADAIDSDFSEGIISGCVFANVGNDGVDTSGSHIQLSCIRMNNIGDKGVSAGESSRLQINNIIISKAEIALTSKDDSDIQGDDIEISDSRLGFAVFMKKTEYGPGNMEVEKVIFDKIDVLYLLENDSKLSINGELQSETEDHVKQRLYGAEFGVKSIK